jgi:tripartite-type tricarboxylate transporter receptor subunit TctC
LARARQNPGKLTYTVTAYGSAYHILTKWIEIESGASLTAVPYQGIAAGVADVLGGRVDVLVDASTSGIPRVKSGQFRALALSSPRRYALLPDAPTVSETLPKVEYMSWLCLAAPPAMPSALTDKLNAEVKAVLAASDFTQRLADLGSVPAPTAPDETRRMVADAIVRWADVIKRGNIKLD